MAPLAGQPPDDDPADLASRLIFRAHPDMVRAAWVRGRRLEGPALTRAANWLRAPRGRWRATRGDRGGVRDRCVRRGPGDRAAVVATGTGTHVVEGERLRLLAPDAPLPEHVGRTIDATGRVVAPGFIDLHSHGGLTILAEPRHEPKVRQGVTTEIVGVDGNGFAPFERREDLEASSSSTPASTAAPTSTTTGARPPSTSPATTARSASTSARSSATASCASAPSAGTTCPADATAIDRMRGRSCATRWPTAPSASAPASTTRPGSYATTDELAALTRTAGEAGGFYHTHVRYPLGDRFLDPFREAIEIGRRAEAPAHITHFYHRQTHPGGPGRAARARRRRARRRPRRHLRHLPVRVGQHAAAHPAPRLDPGRRAGGRSRRGSPTERRATASAPRSRARRRLHERRRLGGRPARGLPAARPPALGVADRRPTSWPRPVTTPVDVICDLLLAEDLGVNQVTSGPWSETLRPFVAHPVGMVGTDSTFIGAKPSPRTYGSFPRILGQFVRDEGAAQPRGGDPQDDRGRGRAARACAQRGTIRDGAFADIVVFDPATVRSNATYDEPRRFPTGIEHVIVNGTLVVDGGTHTGATPGRGIRLGRD